LKWNYYHKKLEMSLMPLSSIQTGKRARFVSIEGGHELRSRLSAMGLIPGVEINVLRNSSRGPLLISVMGSSMMLGQGMAEKILVKQIG